MASVALMGVVVNDDSSAAGNKMFSAPPAPAHLRPLFADLGRDQPAEYRQRSDQLARSCTDRGVRFTHGGEGWPFPLDVVPRLLGALK